MATTRMCAVMCAWNVCLGKNPSHATPSATNPSAAFIALPAGPQDWMRGRRGEGIVALLLSAMHMTLLGALLALSPRPLYVHPHELPPAWSPLDDQHLGGAIMILVGGVSYLAGGLWLSLGILDQRRGLYR